MANKINEYFRGFGNGLEKGLEIVKKDGIEALEQEVKFRKLTGIKTHLTASELDTMTHQIKQTLSNTIEIAFISVLHDVFGFGESRINKALRGFDKIAVYLDKGWITWLDMICDIKDQLNITCEIDNGRELFGDAYYRPDPEDYWDAPDLIDKTKWTEMLANLNLKERKRFGKMEIYDQSDHIMWIYDNAYDKIRIYDFMDGMLHERMHHETEKLWASKKEDLDGEQSKNKQSKRRH